MTTILDPAIAILSPGETVEVVMSGAPSTSQPHWACWWQDSGNPLCNQLRSRRQPVSKSHCSAGADFQLFFDANGLITINSAGQAEIASN